VLCFLSLPPLFTLRVPFLYLFFYLLFFFLFIVFNYCNFLFFLLLFFFFFSFFCFIILFFLFFLLFFIMLPIPTCSSSSSGTCLLFSCSSCFGDGRRVAGSDPTHEYLASVRGTSDAFSGGKASGGLGSKDSKLGKLSGRGKVGGKKGKREKNVIKDGKPTGATSLRLYLLSHSATESTSCATQSVSYSSTSALSSSSLPSASLPSTSSVLSPSLLSPLLPAPNYLSDSCRDSAAFACIRFEVDDGVEGGRDKGLEMGEGGAGRVVRGVKNRGTGMIEKRMRESGRR
jgi:energy-coupling factor transporter transmembrane protein EcfT